MRGKFITLEGGEGCGKSTQIGFIREYLAARGIGTLVTREPGGTPLGEKIRTLLKEKTEFPPVDRAELLLFLAARAQIVEKVIEPALAEGKWVVSDRFSDSTFAYQGYGRGLDLEVLKLANDFACSGLKPDLTFLLEVAPEVALERRHGRETATATESDRIELAGDGFHARLAAGFRRMATAEPERIRTIDASGAPEAVFAKIREVLEGI